MDAQLRHIVRLIQEQHHDEARALLQPYIEANPNEAYAWYLMSFLATNPAEKQAAIRRAVQLAPKDEKYASRLAKLSAKPPPSPSRRLPMALIGAALLVVVVIIFLILNPPGAPTTPIIINATASPAVVAGNSGTAIPTKEATSTPNVTITAAEGFPTPTITPTLSDDPGAPINTAIDIGAGKMSITSVTRPGDSLISQLGGAAANPPSGREWLVVEAQVTCSGSDNCSPDLSGLRIIGSSGAIYAPAPDFSVPQLFGPGAFSGGQMQGYVGFLVPTNETQLRLVLNQNGQQYLFALE